MASCDLFLTAFSIISAATAAWGYYRARVLHWRIESIAPGLNAKMWKRGKRHD